MNSCEFYLEDPHTSETLSGSHTDLSDRNLNPHLLPVFGHFCFRLAALPYCCEEEVLSGPLSLARPSDENPRQTQTVFASLLNWRLRLWTSREQRDSARAPFDSIAVDRDTGITEEGDDVIKLAEEGGKELEFRFEEEGDKHRWLVHLIQHAADHRRWKQVAQNRYFDFASMKLKFLTSIVFFL